MGRKCLFRTCDKGWGNHYKETYQEVKFLLKPC